MIEEKRNMTSSKITKLCVCITSFITAAFKRSGNTSANVFAIIATGQMKLCRNTPWPAFCQYAISLTGNKKYLLMGLCMESHCVWSLYSHEIKMIEVVGHDFSTVHCCWASVQYLVTHTKTDFW